MSCLFNITKSYFKFSYKIKIIDFFVDRIFNKFTSLVALYNTTLKNMWE